MVYVQPSTVLGNVDWGEARELFPCPDVLWQGVWGEVGELYGKTWDVWAAVTTAVGAVAGRGFYWYYVKAPMYGMVYALVVAPTGSGKELPANICGALLPDNYNVRDAVQSGSALYPILAESTERGNSRVCRPTALIIAEWTKLAKNAQIQHSSLADDLNALFHRPRAWNVSRSDRDVSGGDRWIRDVTLSIFGTTTPEKLRNTVTDEMMNDGFMNRYLVLPGPTNEWELWSDIPLPGDPYVVLQGLRGRLQEIAAGEPWGGGGNYQSVFTDAARDKLLEWGRPFFNPVMRSSGMAANRKKRLHMYAHQIAMLSAWVSGRRRVELSDIDMAVAAVECSSKFIDWLWEGETLYATPSEMSDMQAETAILGFITERPDYYDVNRLYDSYKRRAFTRPKIRRAIESLLSARKITINPATMKYRLYVEAPSRPTPGSFVLAQPQ